MGLRQVADFMTSAVAVVAIYSFIYYLIHSFTNLYVVYAFSLKLPQLTPAARRNARIRAMAEAQIVDHSFLLALSLLVLTLQPKLRDVHLVVAIANVPFLINGVYTVLNRNKIPFCHRHSEFLSSLDEDAP
jgi:hypothetical protein